MSEAQRRVRSRVMVGGGEAMMAEVARAVHDHGIEVVALPADGAGQALLHRRPDAIVIEAGAVPGPGAIGQWLESGAIDYAVPVLLVVPEPLAQEAYRAWVEAGVWDILRLPLDAPLLGLRLRNLLGGRNLLLGGPGAAGRLLDPYQWETLVSVTDEILALARRHGRPVSCAAVTLAREAAGRRDDPAAVPRKLAESSHAAMRGSDIVGLGRNGEILVILPDTSAAGAAVAAGRLAAFLERRLKEWGILGRLFVGFTTSPAAGITSGTELLEEAIRSVG